MPTKRTTHRSSKGSRLYAARDRKTGKLTDIQTYRKAHDVDVKRAARVKIVRPKTGLDKATEAVLRKAVRAVTRVEVIDDELGRAYVRDPRGSGLPVKVSLDLQDEGRTLKVFVGSRVK